ncbi:MAG: lipopolysaccharide biosynthesis protein [Bacteroidales bacterium]|nr:lipopolysaccharide biosynthesis protein [Bacteroidales bacterium]
MPDMGVIAKQSIRGALANYAGVAIGFLTTFFVLTRCLTAEEVGMTRVMVDAAMLFSSLAQLGTNSSLVRFFPYFKDGGKNHGVFGWAVLAPLVGFAVFAMAFLLFRDALVGAYVEQSPLLSDYLYLLPMLTFFALYTTVFETASSVLLRITVPKLVREVGIRLFNLVAYLLYGAGVIGFDLFVWLFCGSYGLAMLLNLFYLVRVGHVSFRIERGFLDREMARQIVQYSLFMTATILAGNIPLLNSLFLGAKLGLGSAGVYAIAFYIANVVEVPYRSLGAISKPVIAQAVKDDNWGEVSRLARQVSLHQLIFSCLIFCLIWINLDVLFAMLPNGDQYAAGLWVVCLLGLAKIVNSSFSIAADILNFSRRYPVSLLFIVMLTVLALWLNNSLIGVWQLNGSAAATLLSYVAYFVVLLLYVRIRLGVGLFSAGQLKMMVIAVVMLAMGWVWRQWVEPLFGTMMIVSAVCKTLLVTAFAAWAVYAWRVSDTVCSMIDSRLPRRGHKQR